MIIKVKYLPATNLKGSRFSVSVVETKERKIYSYDYSSTPAHKSAFRQFCADTNIKGEFMHSVIDHVHYYIDTAHKEVIAVD